MTCYMVEFPLSCWSAKDNVNGIDSCTSKVYGKDPEASEYPRKQEGTGGVGLYFGSFIYKHQLYNSCTVVQL